MQHAGGMLLATSSKTGGYLNFRPFPGENANRAFVVSIVTA